MDARHASPHLLAQAAPLQPISAMDFATTALLSAQHASLHITAILAKVEAI